MLTLTFGFKKPENGDKGQTLFDALAANIQKLNDHTHNGSDSSAINTGSITKITQSVAAAGWANPVDGIYNQLVSMVSGLQFDTTTITIREASTGKLMPLPYEKVSASSFRVYCNDPSKDLTIVYA